MLRSRVVEILEVLAAGADPVTGEELSEGGPLNRREVIRALAAAAALLDGHQAGGQKAASLAERNREAGLPLRSNTRWTPEEEAAIQEELLAGATIGEVARGRDRTRGAIVSRLRQLGLLGPEEYRLPAADQDALVRQRLQEGALRGGSGGEERAAQVGS